MMLGFMMQLKRNNRNKYIKEHILTDPIHIRCVWGITKPQKATNSVLYEI